VTIEQYVPVERRGFRLTMGLRPLDLARWLEVDGARQRELAEKARLLAEKHDGVVGVLPGSEAAAGDLLDAVVANLREHHPGVLGGAAVLDGAAVLEGPPRAVGSGGRARRRAQPK
jgi:hypothetical protein